MSFLARIPVSPWFSVALALIVLALAPPTWAKKRRGKKGGAKKSRVVALFPLLSQGEPDPKITGKVFTVMLKAPRAIGGIEVISGTKLKRKLRKPPAQAMGICGSDLACIAKLGKKAKASEVYLVRAESDDGGKVNVMFLVIGAKSKRVDRKMSLSFASVDEVGPKIKGAVFELFDITSPGKLLIAGAHGPVKIDGEVVGEGEGPYEVPPGEHQIEVAGEVVTTFALPDRTIDVEVGTAVAPSEEVVAATSVATPGEPEDTTGETMASGDEGPDVVSLGAEIELASLPPLVAEDAEPESESESGHLLTYVGAGVGALGIIATGVGGYYGYRSSAIGSDLEQKKSKLTQFEVKKREKRANEAASLANLIFIIGGAVTLTGATLAALDLFVLGPSPTATVEVSEDGAAASITFAW